MTNDRPGLWTRIVVSILYGRFEPVETIIAMFCIALGLLLLSPAALPSVFDARYMTLGGWLVLLGAGHLVVLSRTDVERPTSFRKWAIFIMAVTLLFCTLLAFMLGGFYSLTWISLVALTAICGVAYLALSLK